ncbi:MAG: hypothetical protein HOQ09_00390 [Gemmatimonadaceae bacterium]|nr:hypothetical protein [Gemmatimonadaceae bacterium]
MRTTATHRARRAFVVLGVLVPCLTACPPQTQMGNISPAELHGEQLRQQQLVITSALKEQQRLSDVAWPMLTAGVPICGKWVAIQSGAIVTALPDFGRNTQEAARSLGYDDTLTVDFVARGSAGRARRCASCGRPITAPGRTELSPWARRPSHLSSRVATPPARRRGPSTSRSRPTRPARMAPCR